MSRKKSQKNSTKNGFKDLLNGCLRLSIIISVFLSGNDYQITTVIQLDAARCTLATKNVATTQGGRHACPG
jgi:hypothetical protein